MKLFEFLVSLLIGIEILKKPLTVFIVRNQLFWVSPHFTRKSLYTYIMKFTFEKMAESAIFSQSQAGKDILTIFGRVCELILKTDVLKDVLIKF